MMHMEAGQRVGVDECAPRSISPRLLELGLADFRDPRGSNMVARCEPFREWVDAASEAGLFQFLRHHDGAPDRVSEVVGWGGQRYVGINFASQDYLGLARHPAVLSAAEAALRRFGAHSAGSEPMGGGLAFAKALEREIADYVGHAHAVLFPTGWSAGFGTLQGIVRPYDAVVLDALAHNCLQLGAKSATDAVHHFAHNDMDSLRKRLHRLRDASPDQAILVVTESLFSMDSDSPAFDRLVSECREVGASLLVDVAHDLGVLGEQGRGLLWESGCHKDVDFIMGSFSKSFASIGGFLATREKGTSYYVRGFSGAYTFSNYLIPPQIAAIRAALGVARSDDGEALRRDALSRATWLREALESRGIRVLGRPSSLVIPFVGPEPVARVAYRSCLENGVILNNIEYPACRRGEARFRMQVTPLHVQDEIETAANVVSAAIKDARLHYSGFAKARARGA